MNQIHQQIKERHYREQMYKELSNTFMIIKEEDFVWHKYAIYALEFSSPALLGITQEEFLLLCEDNREEINLNCVAWLVNNLEKCTPNQLGVTVKEYAEILQKNIEMANYWKEQLKPIEERVNLRLKISNGNGLKAL